MSHKFKQMKPGKYMGQYHISQKSLNKNLGKWHILVSKRFIPHDKHTYFCFS